MDKREFINKHGVAIGIGGIIIATLVIYFVYIRGAGHVGANGYFIDEETGEEFVMPRTKYPPQIGKSGKPTVVGEFKFSCDGGKTVKVGYLFKYKDEARQKLEDMATGKIPNDPNFGSLGAMMIRLPDKGSPWVPYVSQESVPIRAALVCPEGHDVMMVYP